MDLVQPKISIIAAALRRLEVMRRGHGQDDPLKTAISLEIKGRITSKYGVDLADLQMLRARQKEARAYLHAVTNPMNAAGARTPLAPSLREAALRRTNEIIQQTESDLLKLGEAAESEATILGRRGRAVPNDSSDEPEVEDQQRSENWKTLEERNLAHKYIPQEFTSDLGQFVSSGKEKAILEVTDDGELQKRALQPTTTFLD